MALGASTQISRYVHTHTHEYVYKMLFKLPVDLLLYIPEFLDIQSFLQLWSSCKCLRKLYLERKVVTTRTTKINNVQDGNTVKLTRQRGLANWIPQIVYETKHMFGRNSYVVLRRFKDTTIGTIHGPQYTLFLGPDYYSLGYVDTKTSNSGHRYFSVRKMSDPMNRPDLSMCCTRYVSTRSDITIRTKLRSVAEIEILSVSVFKQYGPMVSRYTQVSKPDLSYTILELNGKVPSETLIVYIGMDIVRVDLYRSGIDVMVYRSGNPVVSKSIQRSKYDNYHYRKGRLDTQTVKSWM